MKYVIVRPAGNHAKIYLLSDGDEATKPFKSWALREGKQIVFATVKMHKVLHTHHMAGSYESGAMYAYTYDELCAIMESYLGPSDIDRALKAKLDQTSIKAKSPERAFNWYLVAFTLWQLLCYILKTLIKVVSVVMFLVILPFILKWFSGFNKH